MLLKFPIILSGNSFFLPIILKIIQFPILKIIVTIQSLLTMFMNASHNKINIVLKIVQI